jgi:hypothetical protein
LIRILIEAPTSLYLFQEVKLQNMLIRKAYMCLLILNLNNKLAKMVKTFTSFNNVLLSKYLTYIRILADKKDLTSLITPYSGSMENYAKFLEETSEPFKAKLQLFQKQGLLCLSTAVYSLERYFETLFSKEEYLIHYTFLTFLETLTFTNSLKVDKKLAFRSMDCDIVSKLVFIYFKNNGKFSTI